MNLVDAIQRVDYNSFFKYLAELRRSLQNDKKISKLLTSRGSMCYAAKVGSTVIMDTLIDTGVGKTMSPNNYYKLNSSSLCPCNLHVSCMKLYLWRCGNNPQRLTAPFLDAMHCIQLFFSSCFEASMVTHGSIRKRKEGQEKPGVIITLGELGQI